MNFLKNFNNIGNLIVLLNQIFQENFIDYNFPIFIFIFILPIVNIFFFFLINFFITIN